MTRLDTQRFPSRVHARSSGKKLWRGYDALPHSIWGDVAGSGAGGSTVTSISPATAAIGASPTITVTGTLFTAQSKVIFEADQRPTTFVSATSLTATVAGLVGPARTVAVAVSTGGSKPFTIT